MRIFWITLLICVSLTGCATTQTLDTQHMTNVITDNKTENKYVFPSNDDLTVCDEELPKLAGKLPSDLYKWGVDVSQIYHTCKNKDKALVNWINNFKQEIDNKNKENK